MVKNTLAERAAKGTGRGRRAEELSGRHFVAYTKGDPVALAKAISKYAKDNPEFTFKAGVVEGRVISIKEIEALATMPSKEEIYSKLLFLMNAPAQRLVTVMNAVGQRPGGGDQPGRGEEQVQGSIEPVWSQRLARETVRPARFLGSTVLMAFETAGESPAATKQMPG